MNIAWKHPICIVCLNSSSLTVEHIIPKSLGGVLTSDLLCQKCNSKFGSGFEANARLAPEVRKTAAQVSKIIPDLVETLEHKARYTAQFGTQTVEQEVRSDGQFGTKSLKDGSLIVPESDAPKMLSSMLRKRGAGDTEVQNALAVWKDASAEAVTNLGFGIKVKRWFQHPASPNYSEPSMNPLVPLKIVYEFAALIVGEAIYHESFQDIRDILSGQLQDQASELVQYDWAKTPDAFHGIVYWGEKKTADFQVRLFGLLAYSVCFPKIAIDFPTTVYTHVLESGSESVHQPYD